MAPCQCHGNREKEKQGQAQVHVYFSEGYKCEEKDQFKLELFSVSFESNYAVALVWFFIQLLLDQKKTKQKQNKTEQTIRTKPKQNLCELFKNQVKNVNQITT